MKKATSKGRFLLHTVEANVERFQAKTIAPSAFRPGTVAGLCCRHVLLLAGGTLAGSCAPVALRLSSHHAPWDLVADSRGIHVYSPPSFTSSPM